MGEGGIAKKPKWVLDLETSPSPVIAMHDTERRWFVFPAPGVSMHETSPQYPDYGGIELRILATMSSFLLAPFDQPEAPAERESAAARRKRGKPTFKDRARESADAKKAMIERNLARRKQA